MIPSDTPEQLTECIRNGDARAFESLFRAQFAPLLRFAAGQVGSRAEAEDVVQEVLLRVWRDRERIMADRPVKSYLFTAVRNEVIDRARRQKRERKWEGAPPGGEERAAIMRPEDAADPSSSTDPAELSELEEAVRAAVASLPERCRTAFLLCREKGLTYAEAAEVMGIAPGTVRIQMSRALAALRFSLRPFLSIVLGLSTLMR
jgi:RNA polymerase sigma-70 factor, ECF subfamily